MITINLLPESQRKRKNKVELKDFPFMPIVFLVIAVVLIVHILLGMLGLYKRVQTISLNSRWKKSQPKIEEIEKIKLDLKNRNQQVNLLGSIVERDFYWTAILEKINKALPQGLWFNRLSVKKDNLVIEGSVFNFGMDEISLLNNFLNDLKKDDFFKINFKNLDLASVHRRKIQSYEIVDFLLSAQIKQQVKLEKEKANEGKDKPKRKK